MDSKTRLVEQIERERKYLAGLTVGSDEYEKSLERLMKLEELVSDQEQKQKQMSEERKDRIVKNILDGIKTTSGIALPLIGLVWITATEKETTFTGVLREYTKYFLPKK